MVKLRPFQRTGVRDIYRFRGRALLADEMGLGKTIEALEWIRKIPRHRPAVIVCPASMKYTWQAEALLHFGMHLNVLEGNCNGATHLRGSVFVLNYDILGSWLPLLRRLGPQCVILDEVHFIKSPQAQRTKATLRLVDQVPSVVGLSGTPLTNRPIELWTILQAIRPDLFPSREAFAWRYCAPRWTFWGWRYDGATHLPELRRILKRECMIRRRKREVLPELPPKQRQLHFFRLAPRAQKEYNRAETDFLQWLADISPERARRARKAQELAKVGYLVRLAAKLKLKWTVQWIKDFFEAHPGEKLVALTMHTFVIDRLRELFPDRCVIVDGRVSGRKRFEAVRQFRSHCRKDLLLGNWLAAGIGINLTAAHNLVALDMPWTPGDLLQGEDRIDRIGQHKSPVIHYLSLLATVEEKQVRILWRKRKILDAVLDGGTGRMTGDLDIFRELIGEFKRQAT